MFYLSTFLCISMLIKCTFGDTVQRSYLVVLYPIVDLFDVEQNAAVVSPCSQRQRNEYAIGITHWNSQILPDRYREKNNWKGDKRSEVDPVHCPEHFIPKKRDAKSDIFTILAEEPQIHNYQHVMNKAVHNISWCCLYLVFISFLLHV